MYWVHLQCYCLWSAWNWGLGSTLLRTEAGGGCLALSLSILEVTEKFLSRASTKRQMHEIQECRSSAFTQQVTKVFVHLVSNSSLALKISLEWCLPHLLFNFISSIRVSVGFFQISNSLVSGWAPDWKTVHLNPNPKPDHHGKWHTGWWPSSAIQRHHASEISQTAWNKVEEVEEV